MSSIDDDVSRTAEAVLVKLGRLRTAGVRMVVCQEILNFFKDLEGEGVGTGAVESKARKMVEETLCKNLVTLGGIQGRKGVKIGTNENSDKSVQKIE